MSKATDLRLSQRERLLRNEDLDILWGMIASIDRLRVREYTSTAVTRYEPIAELLETARKSMIAAEEEIRGLAR